MAAVAPKCPDPSLHLEGQHTQTRLVESRQSRKPSRKRKASGYRSGSYEPLRSKRGYIRVLNLRGGSTFENPIVDCELIVQEFHPQKRLQYQYEALSWCWGTTKPTATININKDGVVYAKKVSPDLVVALRSLRHEKEDRILWIDQICINQKNPQEKNHQVEMMADIYGRAKQVCVWLGDGDESSRMALRFIRNEVLQLQNFDELCESELASQKWGALLDLMQRPWFSRRWVVQEIALARKATIHCGGDKIPWKKFAVAVELFVEVETATHRLSEVMKKDPRFYHVPGWFEYVSALGASLLVEATGKLFRDYKPNRPANNITEIEDDSDAETETDSDLDSQAQSDNEADSEPDSEAELEAETEQSNTGQPLLSLEYLVSSLSIFDVTTPHDAVYALLAIAKDTIPVASDENKHLVLDHTQEALEGFTQKKRYPVDYNQPFSDVCKEFVQFCIDHSDPSRALDIICRPWAPDTPMPPPKRVKIDAPKDAEVPEGSALDKEKTGSTKITRYKVNVDDKSIEKKEAKSKRPRKVKDRMPLPSWIPQLTGAAFGMLPQAGVHTLKMGRKNADTLVGLPASSQSHQRNYKAAETKNIDYKTLRFAKRVNMRHHSMFVMGFVLDNIVEHYAASQGGAIPSGWAKAGGWRNVPQEDPPDAFWRTLVADRGRDGRNPPVYYSRACKESFIKGGLSSGSVNTTDLINNERCSVVAQFCRRVQAVIWNKRLIKTHGEKLGLTSENAQLNDLIVILYGCSVPVVLRRNWKSLDQVQEEVNEDIKLWQEDFVATWKAVCRTRRSKRVKRAYLGAKWWRWDQERRRKWIGDAAWQKNWDSKLTNEVARQKQLDYELLIGEINQGKALMGYCLRNPKELDGEYNLRLKEKSYYLWNLDAKALVKAEAEKAEKAKKLEATAKTKTVQGLATDGGIIPAPMLPTNETGTKLDIKWDEPQPNWQEFKLFLRFGRRWKAAWTRTNELNLAHERLVEAQRKERTTIETARRRLRIMRCQDKNAKEKAETNLEKLEARQRAMRAAAEYRIIILENKEKKIREAARERLNMLRKTDAIIHAAEEGKEKLRARDPKKHCLVANGDDNMMAEMVDEMDHGEFPTNGHKSPDNPNRDAYNPEILLDDSNKTAQDEPVDSYIHVLREQLLEKFKLDPKHDLEPPGKIIDPKESEDVQRMKQHWCYYEMLGECYVHGMMDGEAMAYQNEHDIRAQVFEIR